MTAPNAVNVLFFTHLSMYAASTWLTHCYFNKENFTIPLNGFFVPNNKLFHQFRSQVIDASARPCKRQPTVRARAPSHLSKQYKTRDVIDNDRGHDNPLTPFFVGWHRANNTHEKNARRTPVILLLFLISTSVAPI